MATARLVQRFREQSFIPTVGQTVFTLSESVAPTDGLVLLFVNGVVYERNVDFTAVGATVTWLDIPFTLAPVDCVLVVYDFI